MRDILAHQYDKIRINIIWNVVIKGIPELLEQVVPLVLEPQPELENVRPETMPSGPVGPEQEQAGFIASVLPGLISMENAARQYGDSRLQGAFAVVVIENGLGGLFYQVMEEERFLFSVTIRDRQIIEVSEFNLAPEELDGARSRVETQKHACEALLQQMQAIEAEDDLEL